jgi:hypothetical protein
VVRAQGPELGRELDAAAVTQLVGVQVQVEAAGLRSQQHLAALVDVERTRLAERVGRRGQGGAGIEHRAVDQSDIAVAVRDVRAEERGVWRDGAGHLEQPALVVDGQSIS